MQGLVVGDPIKAILPVLGLRDLDQELQGLLPRWWKQDLGDPLRAQFRGGRLPLPGLGLHRPGLDPELLQQGHGGLVFLIVASRRLAERGRRDAHAEEQRHVGDEDHQGEHPEPRASPEASLLARGRMPPLTEPDPHLGPEDRGPDQVEDELVGEDPPAHHRHPRRDDQEGDDDPRRESSEDPSRRARRLRSAPSARPSAPDTTASGPCWGEPFGVSIPADTCINCPREPATSAEGGPESPRRVGETHRGSGDVGDGLHPVGFTHPTTVQ